MKLNYSRGICILRFRFGPFSSQQRGVENRKYGRRVSCERTFIKFEMDVINWITHRINGSVIN